MKWVPFKYSVKRRTGSNHIPEFSCGGNSDSPRTMWHASLPNSRLRRPYFLLVILMAESVKGCKSMLYLNDLWVLYFLNQSCWYYYLSRLYIKKTKHVGFGFFPDTFKHILKCFWCEKLKNSDWNYMSLFSPGRKHFAYAFSFCCCLNCENACESALEHTMCSSPCQPSSSSPSSFLLTEFFGSLAECHVYDESWVPFMSLELK